MTYSLLRRSVWVNVGDRDDQKGGILLSHFDLLSLLHRFIITIDVLQSNGTSKWTSWQQHASPNPIPRSTTDN